MLIETKNTIYITTFNHAQIEITGCCNMHCKHCRADNEKNIFMPLDKINKIFDFASMHKSQNFNLTLSGGEPFLHPQFVEILKMAVKRGYKEIVVTTNGSLITDELMQSIDEFSQGTITIQVSLDSIYSHEHDEFRGYEGAYNKAIEGLDIIKKYKNVHSSIRMTVKKETYEQMEDMVKIAIDKGCIRIGIGNIIPAGLGANEFTLTPKDKKNFLISLASMHNKYKNQIDITTEDPLKAVIQGSPWIDEDILKNELVEGLFGGCSAGIDCFNVDTNYNFTPCSVFRKTIVNLNDYEDLLDLSEAYSQSEIIKKMCERVFDGKCNDCSHKRICGGCRATASYFGEGNYFYSDGTCWL